MNRLGEEQAGWAGIIGGVLWALTPLRQPVFGAGRTPDEGELFFRCYNLVLIVIAVLLTVALLHQRRGNGLRGRGSTFGWWTMLLGHLLIVVGSVPAVFLGGALRPVVMGGQDLGFAGAMIAALGALILGISAVRTHGLPSSAAWLLTLTLPLGIGGMLALAAMGTPSDYQGLPLTVLYGGAFVALALHWLTGKAETLPPRRTTSLP